MRMMIVSNIMNFSWIDSDTTLKSDTQYRGLSMFANDYYPISLVANESTSNNGYRTYYGLKFIWSRYRYCWNYCL